MYHFWNLNPLNKFLLWGRETPTSWEDLLGEYDSLDEAKSAYEAHNAENDWYHYRISLI